MPSLRDAGHDDEDTARAFRADSYFANIIIIFMRRAIRCKYQTVAAAFSLRLISDARSGTIFGDDTPPEFSRCRH